MSDAFGPEFNVESAADQERGYVAELPDRLRGLVCRPREPWVGERPDPVPPGWHDHGHTMCYFVNLAADHIEELRIEVAILRNATMGIPPDMARNAIKAWTRDPVGWGMGSDQLEQLKAAVEAADA